MSDPGSGGIAGLALIKAYGLKAIAGAIATGLMFAVLWPKTKREGVMRISCTIAGSMLWGGVLLAMVRHYAPWFPTGEEAAMPVYVAAGAPAWWVLGMVARWLDKRRGQDIGEVIDQVRGKRRGSRS